VDRLTRVYIEGIKKIALSPGQVAPLGTEASSTSAQLIGAGANIISDVVAAKYKPNVSGSSAINSAFQNGGGGVLGSNLLKNTSGLVRGGVGIGAGIGAQYLAQKGLDYVVPTKGDGSSFVDEMKGFGKSVISGAAGGYTTGGPYGAVVGAFGSGVGDVVGKGVRIYNGLNAITKQNEEGPRAMFDSQEHLNDINGARNIAKHNAMLPKPATPPPLDTANPMTKQSDFIGSGLSAIPMMGGALSGSWSPMNGESSMESENKLKPYSIGGTAAGPIAHLIGRSSSVKNGLKRMFLEGKAPTTKAGLKGFLLQSLLAASAGSAAGTAIGRDFETKHFAGKYGEEKIADHGIMSMLGSGVKNIGSSIGNFGSEVVNDPWQAVKDTGSLVGDGAKMWFVDPFLNAGQEAKNSMGLLASGDYQGGAGKLVSAAGDAAFGIANFIPGAGVLGKGLGLGAKAIGAGARLMNLDRAGEGIEAAGRVAKGVLNMPKDYVNNTPGIGHIIGEHKLVPPNAADGAFTRGIKHVGNYAPNIIATQGLNIAGDHMYDTSDSGRMDQIAQSPVLNKYFGDSFSNQVQGLSPADKLNVYRKLKDNGATTQLADLDQKYYDSNHG